MNIQNKWALITGGGSGMGEAVSRHLAKKGAKVAILDKSEAHAKKVAEEVGGIAAICDVGQASSLENAWRELEQKGMKSLSITVNCAGIAPAKRMVGKEGPVPLSWFENVINVNLIGTFNVMRLSVAQMMKNEGEVERGVIINTASIAAYEGQIGQTAYSASKGGVVAMTLPAARECAKWGIRVMTIAPGLIETPMLQGFTDEVKQSLIENTVFPKRLGEATEFASLVQHIIENSLLNGEVIRLDGAVRLGVS
jgi:NAD(P)-dependent dehydrogenase (short-subunit alcohol dehydrogenase family)